MSDDHGLSITQKILIGVFVSVASGLILYFLTGDRISSNSAKPAPQNPLYAMLEKEQKLLDSMRRNLNEKETQLINAKQKQGFIGKFIDSEEVDKIQHEISFLERTIEESEERIIKLHKEVNRELDQSKTSDNDNNFLLAIVTAVLAIGTFILLLFVGGG